MINNVRHGKNTHNTNLTIKPIWKTCVGRTIYQYLLEKFLNIIFVQNRGEEIPPTAILYAGDIEHIPKTTTTNHKFINHVLGGWGGGLTRYSGYITVLGCVYKSCLGGGYNDYIPVL